MILNQRSQDTIVAGEWNVVQYAILLHMFARHCGYEVGELVHVISDCHIYDRHIEAAKELLSREPFPAPKLWINPDKKNFYNFTVDDFKLIDYQHHDQIKNLPVAV
jgi:thymidylate synthase